MKFQTTPIGGVTIVDLNRLEDERGFFARAFCTAEFEQQGLNNRIVQANTSFNHHAGTLRGMHYQTAPALETKFIRCICGAIYDVIVDLRPSSPTYKQHFGIELSASNRTALFVPANVAHGFVTLMDNSEVFYLVSNSYTPDCERGLRYDDPELDIHWPKEISHISQKDTQWPLLS